MGQFFTPDAVAALLWRIVSPAFDAAIASQPGGRVALLDTSVGSGRLFQFADPKKHRLAGADVHGPSIDAMILAAEAAGFDVDLIAAPLETLRPKGFHAALLNPPFSLHLDHPNLMPLPGNTFGRYGEFSSAVSHIYAIEQALVAADVVLAIVPRTASARWRDDPSRHDRLRAVLALPARSFEEEGTEVAVDVVVFGHPRDARQPVTLSLAHLDASLPDFDLRCHTDVTVHPRPLSAATIAATQPSITLPVTGNTTVRVVHDGRKIALRFACGLVEAKVRNHLLQRPVEKPSDTHRYPKHIQFHGQGVFDRDLYLAQPDPLQAFQATLNAIADAGGTPVVDPGLTAHLRKAHRRLQRERTPFRHVVRSATAAVPTGATMQATPRVTRLVDPNRWGSAVLLAGQTYPVAFDGAQYVVTHVGSGETLTLEEPAFISSFDVVGPRATTEAWTVVHEGRVAAFPQLAHTLRVQMERAGITAWLDRDYQQHDLIELLMGRGATVAWLMSLGKTRLAVALALMGGRHCLVVLAPHLIDEFRRELEKIGLDRALWQVIRRPDQCESLRKINIISYNRLRSPVSAGAGRRTYASRLRRRISTLLADEGDVLANQHSQQSQALAMVSPRRKFPLSGTPCRNLPRDVLGVTHYASGDGTPVQSFGRHRPYCAPYLLRGMDHATTGAQVFLDTHAVLQWVTNEFITSDLRKGAKREVPKVRNLAKLREYVAPLVKRRVHDEPEVARYITIPKPEKIVTTIGWDDAHLAHFIRIADNYASWYANAKRQAAGQGKGVNLVAKLQRIGVVCRAGNNPQFPTPGFGTYAPLTTKQRYLIERMTQLAADGRKTICLVDQPSMVNLLVTKLAERNIEAVPCHGQLPIVRRVKDMDLRFRFGNAPTLIATLDVMDSGYNIPQANYALLGCRSWVARTEAQAIARMLRGEQTADVTAEYVHLAGSLDEYQAQVVAMKGDSIDASIDYLTPELQDEEFKHMDTILEEFLLALSHRRGFQHGYELREALKRVA